MVQHRNIVPSWFRITVVLLSVGGGFTGLSATLPAMFGQQQASAMTYLIYALFASLHLFLLIAGLLFVQNARRLMPLVFAYFIQLPVLSSPLLTFRFGPGLFVMVGVDQRLDMSMSFRFGAEWSFYLMQSQPWMIGVNLTAISVFVILVFCIARQSSSS